MADKQQPKADYNTDVSKISDQEFKDIQNTANKIPADHSEQRTTTSTEGTVERTTSDTPRKS